MLSARCGTVQGWRTIATSTARTGTNGCRPKRCIRAARPNRDRKTADHGYGQLRPMLPAASAGAGQARAFAHSGRAACLPAKLDRLHGDPLPAAGMRAHRTGLDRRRPGMTRAAPGPRCRRAGAWSWCGRRGSASGRSTVTSRPAVKAPDGDSSSGAGACLRVSPSIVRSPVLHALPVRELERPPAAKRYPRAQVALRSIRDDLRRERGDVPDLAVGHVLPGVPGRFPARHQLVPDCCDPDEAAVRALEELVVRRVSHGSSLRSRHLIMARLPGRPRSG